MSCGKLRKYVSPAPAMSLAQPLSNEFPFFASQALRCRCEGNLLRMGPVALGDPEIGQEAPALGIFDQMQNAREEVAFGFGAADIDDTCVLEFVIKEP